MADSEWEDVTAQHAPGTSEWEDVTHQGAPYEVPRVPTPLTGKGRAVQDIQDAQHKDWGGAMNNAVSMMTGGGLAKVLGKRALGALGVAGESGLVGAAQSPDDRLGGFLTGAVMPKALDTAGGVLGAGARGLIQKAMNISEPTREIGQRLLDSGIWGTRNSMAKQVERGISREGEGLSHAVGKLNGAIEVAPLASKMEDRAAALKIGSEVPPELADLASKYENSAGYLGNQGAMDPKDLLKYKQMQGQQSYSKKGSPLSSEAAQVSHDAMTDSGNLLKDEYSRQYPNTPNSIAEQNDKLSALFKADKGLAKKPGLMDYVKGSGQAAVANLVGGPVATAALLAAKSSIGQSGAARGLNLGKKVVDKVDPAVLRTIFLSNGNKSGPDSAP